MQVQKLIEQLRKGSDHQPELANAIVNSHKFAFDSGNVPENILDAASDYTRDLLSNGILPVPFDNCLFEFGPGGIGDMCVRFWVFVGRYEIEEPPGWQAWMATATQIKRPYMIEQARQTGVSLDNLPLVNVAPDLAKILPEPATDNEPAGAFQVYGNKESEHYKKFMNNYEESPGLRQIASDQGINAHELYSNISFDMFSPAFGYLLSILGLLSTKSGVKTTEVTASRPEIDAKRIKQGKAPLGYEHKVVTIDPGLLKMPGVVTAGGTHASPRMHWRRGHIRHYGDGKVTPVRPAIIGDVSRGVITHDYALKPRGSLLMSARS